MNSITNESPCLIRRIGSTTYKVRVHLAEDGGETMSDKILHLIQNEQLSNDAHHGIINMPQMSRPPEGSSL